jgi:hypothetical protein
VPKEEIKFDEQVDIGGVVENSQKIFTKRLQKSKIKELEKKLREEGEAKNKHKLRS